MVSSAVCDEISSREVLVASSILSLQRCTSRFYGFDCL